MNWRASLSSALDEPDMERSVARVHETLLLGLRDVTTGSRIRRTGYFNHSWVPDFVVEWSRGDHRDIFLRFGVDHPSFAFELETFDQEAPIFVALTEPERATSPAPQWDTNCLVTDADGLAVLQGAATTDRSLRGASRELVRGGRGRIDSQGADAFVSSYKQISSASAFGDPITAASAFESMTRVLSPASKARLERSLFTQGVLEGTLAPSALDLFEVTPRSTSERHELVAAFLDQPRFDRTMWKPLAASMSFDEFNAAVRTGRGAVSDRLTELAMSGAHLWTARYAYAPPLPGAQFDESVVWHLAKFGTTLRAANRDISFSDSGRRFSSVPSDWPLPELGDRFSSLEDPFVVGVSLVTRQENLAMTLRETASRSIADVVHEVIQEESRTWRSALVHQMVVRTQDRDSEVTIDFRRNVASASHALRIAEFVTLIARYMTDAPPATRQTLTALFEESV